MKNDLGATSQKFAKEFISAFRVASIVSSACDFALCGLDLTARLQEKTSRVARAFNAAVPLAFKVLIGERAPRSSTQP